MALQLGDRAPDFEADTTEGRIGFHDWIGDNWALLFAHPKDFTPVCTTELVAVARLESEFEKRKVKVISLSVDSISHHDKWSGDIRETQGVALNFPLIADPDRRISRLYNMVHPNAKDALTARALFIIGPDKKIKMMSTYPATTGHNFDEILRCIDAVQLSESHQVVTPANWRQGEDVMVAPTLSDDEARKLFPDGWKALKPYLRIVRHPEN